MLPPQILAVQPLTGPAAAYRVTEYAVKLKATYQDPFDPGDIALDAKVTTPGGKTLSVPGFLYQPFRKTRGHAVQPIPIASTAALEAGKASPTRTVDDAEIMVPAGPAQWRLRFTPSAAGVYRIEFTLKTKQGIARSKALLKVAKGRGGFVRVSTRDSRYFALDDGSPYWPIGANLGWAGPAGTRDYDRWLAAYQKAGANWGRLWLSPHWTTFALETKRLGQFDLGNAWRLDDVLNQAQRRGIRLALCIDSYNVFRDRVAWPEWERSPHRLLLKRPADFWTDPEAARLYRNKLRYLVARWGANPGTMAWEFWNEVDGVTDYQADAVRKWHGEMAAYLHKIDPYGHPTTTSFGGSGEGAKDASIFALPGLDFSQSHRYDDPDLALGVLAAQTRLGALGKPHFVGEVGADASGDRAADDPTGLQIHDPIWASLAGGSAGAAMPWWWDSYIDPKDKYGLFAALARFTKGIAFDREGFRPIVPAVAYAVPPRQLPRRDAVPLADGVGWTAAPHFKPQTVRIDVQGMSAPRLAKVLQGVGNHPDLHNPVTFETNLPWPTRLIVQIGDVSGYGGAALKIVRDGETIVEKAFPDPDGDRDNAPHKEFAGAYAVELPPGWHTVIVENPGQDWVEASYRVENALQKTQPPLLARAIVGKRTAVLWVRHEDLAWRAVVAGRKIDPAPPAVVTVPSLTPGRWRLERWDTWTGQRLEAKTVTIGTDQELRIGTPKLTGDQAYKLVRL